MPKITSGMKVNGLILVVDAPWPGFPQGWVNTLGSPSTQNSVPHGGCILNALPLNPPANLPPINAPGQKPALITTPNQNWAIDDSFPAAKDWPGFFAIRSCFNPGLVMTVTPAAKGAKVELQPQKPDASQLWQFAEQDGTKVLATNAPPAPGSTPLVLDVTGGVSGGALELWDMLFSENKPQLNQQWFLSPSPPGISPKAQASFVGAGELDQPTFRVTGTGFAPDGWAAIMVLGLSSLDGTNSLVPTVPVPWSFVLADPTGKISTTLGFDNTGLASQATAYAIDLTSGIISPTFSLKF
jgi:hypothetical protein